MKTASKVCAETMGGGFAACRPESKKSCLLLFVRNENGKLRLVFDCRVPNRLFKAAPNIPMGTGAVWAHMKIPDNELLYMATSDIYDYFYACEIPGELSEFFVVETIDAKTFSTWCAVSGLPSAYIDSAHLGLCILPTGWTWAFYFAQMRHAASLSLCSFIETDGVLEDVTATPLLSKEACVALPYCDNLGVGSLSASLCGDAQNDIINAEEAFLFSHT